VSRTGYLAQFEEIWPGNPALGRASLLPWDAEVFGFPVGSYQIGVEQLDDDLEKEFLARFLSWSQDHGVRVCMCSIPATNSRWKLSLAKAGFSFVDFALQANLNGLQTAQLPGARTTLRGVEPGEWESVEAIAEHAFNYGRYHADPLFPRELADLRYRRWIRNARSEESESNPVYVLGEPGAIQGFYHVTIDGDVADLRLAALAPGLQGTMLGFDLYLSVLHVLKQLGVRRVVTSISAGNTAVMNVYAMLGFSFSGAEAVYHWHAVGMHGRAAE
jgi:RimJ/RimL family protein N-acetyltransferase